MTLDTRTARRGEPNRWLELGRWLANQEETEAKPRHGEKGYEPLDRRMRLPSLLVGSTQIDGAMLVDLDLLRFGVWFSA